MKCKLKPQREDSLKRAGIPRTEGQQRHEWQREAQREMRILQEWGDVQGRKRGFREKE